MQTEGSEILQSNKQANRLSNIQTFCKVINVHEFDTSLIEMMTVTGLKTNML